MIEKMFCITYFTKCYGTNFPFLYPQSDSEPTSPEAAFKNFMKTEGVNPLNVPINLLKK